MRPNRSASAMPDPLRPARMRLAAITAVVLLAVCLGTLWPARRRGLVLYATSESAATLAASFTARTGVPITVVRLSTGPMLARIAAEGDRPQWALAWIDGDIAAASLDRAGLLARGMTPTVPWTPVGRTLLPRDGAWVPTGLTLAGVTLRRRGSRGPVGMPDPAISGPAFPELAGLSWAAGGWPAGKTALLAMRSRGLSVAPTSPAVVQELDAGRIGSALIQSSTAYAMAHRGPALAVRVPRPAFMLPGVLMVAKHAGSGSRRQAARFIEFVLSAEAQRGHLAMGAVDSYYWPLTNDVAGPPFLPPVDRLSLVHLDPNRWAPLQAEMTTWFEAEAARR